MGYNIDNFICVCGHVCVHMCVYMYVFNVGQSNRGAWDLITLNIKKCFNTAFYLYNFTCFSGFLFVSSWLKRFSQLCTYILPHWLGSVWQRLLPHLFKFSRLNYSYRCPHLACRACHSVLNRMVIIITFTPYSCFGHSRFWNVSIHDNSEG